MKKVTTIIPNYILTIVFCINIGMANAQTLQSAKLTKKGSVTDSSLKLNSSPVIPKLTIDSLKIQSPDISSHRMELKSLEASIERSGDDARDLIDATQNSKIATAIKSVIASAANEINDQTNEIKSLIDEAKDEKNTDERKRMEALIIVRTKALEEAKEKLLDYSRKFQLQLNKNKQLQAKLNNLNKELENMKKEISFQIENLNKQIVALHKDNYNATIELFTAQGDKLKENATTLNKKIEELKTNFSKLSWLKTKDLSEEDQQIIVERRDELRDQLNEADNRRKILLDKIKDFDETLTKYKEYGPILNSGLDITSEYINESIQPARKETRSSINAVATSYNDYNNKLIEYAAQFDRVVIELNPRLEKYKKEEKNEQNFSAYGGFKKILQEEGAFIPDINVFAQKQFGTQGFGGYGQIRLFTGLNTDNANYNTSLNYFVPEASTYGLAIDLGMGFQTIKGDQAQSNNFKKHLNDLGFNTSFYFLGKKLKPTDSLTINSNTMQWRLGFEMLPFQNFISLRININGLFVSNKYDQIAKFYNSSNDTKWFTNIALTALLDLNETKDFKLRFELDFIPLSSDLKEFIGTKDKVLPQIKLELVKNF